MAWFLLGACSAEYVKDWVGCDGHEVHLGTSTPVKLLCSMLSGCCVIDSLVMRHMSRPRPLFNSSGYSDLRVRAVTPLTVLLCLGSCLIDPSHLRAVRLLSWGGFNALFGSTGTLNII